MNRKPIGYKKWVVNERDEALELYVKTFNDMCCIARVRKTSESTYECDLRKQYNKWSVITLCDMTTNDVIARIEDDILAPFEEEAKKLREELAKYEDFIKAFKGELYI